MFDQYTRFVQHADVVADLSATIDDDYAEAIIRLAWAVDSQTRERILLCGAVELLPREIPAPFPRPERRHVASRRFRLFARDVVVTAARGLTWFGDATRGIGVRPEQDGTLRDATDAAAVRFRLEQLDAEPPGAALLAARTSVPFSADWESSIRAKHLVSDASPMRAWTEAERSTAVEWLSRECQVDLDTLPEYAGSVHLIAPNPIFRELFVRYDDARSELVVAIVPRARRSVSGLALIVEEKRTTGIGVVACVTIEEPIVRVRMPYFPGDIRERIVDPRRGLLHDGSFGRFGIGYSMRVDLMTTTRRVNPGASAEPYEVPLVGGFKSTSDIPGRAPQGTAASVLARATVDRRRRQRGAAEQRWFRDQAPDALRALRELVTSAKGEILLCDPYFEAGDLLRLVLAVADPETVVRILTSAHHLRKGRGSIGDALEAQLAEVRAAPPVSPIDIHVMPGKKPPIHDRFVVLGDATWMLGSSINHYGERGTLMVIVPDPEPVRMELEAMWNASESLADWLSCRRAAGPR